MMAPLKLTWRSQVGFDLFDIDGTLTVPGCDLWHMVTRQLSVDADAFELAFDAWQSDVAAGEELVERSRLMMQYGVDLLSSDANALLIRSSTCAAVLQLIEAERLHREALEFLASRFHQNITPVLVTANYVEGAWGFLDALLLAGLIDKKQMDAFRVSGSVVDWDLRKVTHVNVGVGKVFGAAAALGVDHNQLPGMVRFAFGDDPAGNDSALLGLAVNPMVVTTERNRDLLLAAPARHFLWCNWKEALVA